MPNNPKPMTVGELIEFLKTVPPEWLVAHQIYSEQELLVKDDILKMKACAPRPDGWIQSFRTDKPEQMYLLFPGN
jgi:hypothetical protein